MLNTPLPDLQPPARRPGYSLRTRITLFALASFVLSVWTLVLIISHTLENDLGALLGKQQQTLATVVASGVELAVTERLQALEQVAAQFDAAALDDAALAQQRLVAHPVFQRLFNGGSFIVRNDGTAIATYPVSVARQGVNYSDRDYVRNALAGGGPAIGRPVRGRKVPAPIVGMAAPIRDAAGRVIGALAGVINLDAAGLLDQAGHGPSPQIGTGLLIDARHRTILADSQRQRILEALPAPGHNAVIDRFVQGFEGSASFTTPAGVPVLTSVRHVPVAGWYVAMQMPTAEAFAPVRAMQRQLLLSALVLTTLAGALMWWMLSRHLAPLQRTAAALARVPEGGAAMAPLPLTRSREIDQVITAFNSLLGKLGERQAALNDSEALYRAAFHNNPDAVAITCCADDHIVDVNEGFLRSFGCTREQVVGQPAARLDRAGVPSLLQALRGRPPGHDIELDAAGPDGAVLNLLVSVAELTLAGQPCRLTVARDITERKAAAAQIHRLAHVDTLTRLPNRRLLLDRLQQALTASRRDGHRGALICIDLDHFQTLNDTQGHDKGDLLLVEVAQRLSATVRSDDTVARLGGDEFVVLLDNLGADTPEAGRQAKLVAEKILAALCRPAQLDGLQHHGTASVGLALFGEHDEGAAEPLKRAELAMYQAKSAGRRTLRCFNPTMQADVNSRVALEARLREALEQGQLVLHYQPQVAQARVRGVEALVRWQDPLRGMVSPAEFIPVAEATGLILPLGAWVLETACRQLALWARTPELAHLTMSVNLSALQLHGEDFVELVRGTLQRTGAPPARLTLELTESLLVDQIEHTIAKMNRVKALGVGFALDDFGTGFSSLSYLKRLPLDELKIDRSFVKDILSDPNDMAIAKMVVALGEALGLAVIAEGVETPAQRDALAALGCRSYQGYLFGRPQPVQALEALLREGVPA